VGHIDPKPVGSAVGPEANGASEVLANFLVLPVEVRLLSSETVEIPLAVASRCPGLSAEERFPVVGRQLTASATAISEEITITFRSTATRG